jgi:hypothetical protein
MFFTIIEGPINEMNDSHYTIWQYHALGYSPTGATLPNLDVWNGDETAVEK